MNKLKLPDDLNLEHIVAAAVYRETDKEIYSMVPPYRHHDILQKMWGTLDTMSTNDVIDQGFLTSKNRFINRKEAKAIALSAMQVKDFNCLKSDELFTEDLW